MIMRIFTLFLIFWTSSALAQDSAFNPGTGESYPTEVWGAFLPDTFDLFSSDEPLDIRLKSDFRTLLKNKYKDEYQKAELFYTLSDTVALELDIRIKPRGNFRKKNCAFPPLRLNFKKTTFYFPHVQQFEKMKMVTDCKRTDTFEQYLLREYLIYKLYSMLTPVSFSARLLKITYEDTGKENETYETFAFVIEELDDVALRNNSLKLDTETYTQELLRSPEMLTFSIFQFMIGNLDWSVPGLHNTKVIKSNNVKQPLPQVIPYDFDYTGFVNTYYAIPKKHLGLNSIKDRYFLGICYDSDEIMAVLKKFLDKQQDMEALIREFPYLTDETRDELEEYMDDFFDMIDNRNSWRYFRENCKSR